MLQGIPKNRGDVHLMTVVYVVSQNGKMTCENKVLYYSDYAGNRTKILPDKVEQMVVVGDMELSGQALNLMMRKRIDVSFLSRNGFFNGRIVYQDSKNSLLRHRQHACLDNEAFSLSLARDIVRGKIHNEYLFLQRLERKIGKTRRLDASLSSISRIRSSLEHASSLEEVRGHEGIAAKLYFDCLGLNLAGSGFQFMRRSKNPPKDEVNSVLSFLYTVLANRMEKYIIIEGLDSSVGSLHSLAYGRKSLVFDLIEEFRTPIVDTLVCAVFNLGVLSHEDFRTESVSCCDMEMSESERLASDEQIGVLLTESGMRKALQQFERKLASEHKYPLNERTISYDAIMQEQVRQYKHVIMGEIDHYIPMVVT